MNGDNMEPVLKKSKTEAPEEEKAGPMVTLLSSDKQIFQVEVGILSESGILNLELEQGKSSPYISVPYATGPTLARLIQYCRKHADCCMCDEDEDELKRWDVEFVSVDKGNLYDLLMAAKYLEIKKLLELIDQALGI